MSIKTLNKNAGYSLVETLVAITILMLAIASPLTIAFKSMQSAQYAKQQATAFLLAQEGVEAVTYMRNHQIIRAFNGVSGISFQNVWDWVDDGDLDPCFINNSVSYVADGDVGCNVDFRDNNLFNNSGITDCNTLSNCLMDHNPSSDPRYRINNGAASDDTVYTRVIQIEHINNREIRVTSEVSWSSTLFGATESVKLVTHLYKHFEGLP